MILVSYPSLDILYWEKFKTAFVKQFLSYFCHVYLHEISDKGTCKHLSANLKEQEKVESYFA